MLIKGAKLLWVLAPVGWVTILSLFLFMEVPRPSACNQESSSLRQQNALVHIVGRSLGPVVLGSLSLRLVPPSGSDSLVLHLPAVLLLALHSDQDGGPYLFPQVFTRVMALILAIMHRMGYRIYRYLDDGPIWDSTRQGFFRVRDFFLHLC